MPDWLELELAERLAPTEAPDALWAAIERGRTKPPTRAPRPKWPLAAIVTIMVAAGALWMVAKGQEPALAAHQRTTRLDRSATDFARTPAAPRASARSGKSGPSDAAAYAMPSRAPMKIPSGGQYAKPTRPPKRRPPARRMHVLATIHASSAPALSLARLLASGRISTCAPACWRIPVRSGASATHWLQSTTRMRIGEPIVTERFTG